MGEDNNLREEVKENPLFTGVEDSDDEKSEDEASFNPILDPIDRPRGILSSTDREYLCGLKDYSHNQTELNRRQAIRERTIEAIRDLDLLWLLLAESEWEKIIDAFDPEELNHFFASIISFMYVGIDQDPGRMKEVLEYGLYGGANYDTSGRWSGKANNVTVEIDIDYEPNLDELYQRVEEGDADKLTPAEVGALVKSGKIDPDELDKFEETGPEFPGVYVGGPVNPDDESGEE